VLDASAAINLLGSGIAPEILHLLAPLSVTIARNTANEVLSDPGSAEYLPLNALCERSLIRIIEPSAATTELAVELMTAAEPDDLGDGESFAIALASVISGAVVLDDQKARRVCSARHPQVPLLDSIQLFRHPLISELGTSRLKVALRSALQISRMRVLEKDFAWVREVLGEEVDELPTLRRLVNTWSTRQM
jgi:hypothetical protein